jgi:hypothetical protein
MICDLVPAIGRKREGDTQTQGGRAPLTTLIHATRGKHRKSQPPSSKYTGNNKQSDLTRPTY